MRIVLLSQYYPPEIGAPQARLSELVERMARAGHDVTVLTAMPNYPEGRIHPGFGGFCMRAGENGVRLIRTFIYPTKSAGFFPRIANYFSFVFSSAVVGTFCLRRSDFLIAESPPLFLGLSGLWLARIKGARLIFNVSDLWPESVVRLGRLREGSFLHRFSLWLERLCYKGAWVVSGQSQGILDDIRRRFPSVRTFHFSNGVDPSLFNPQRRSGLRHERLGGGRKCVAVYAGLHGLAQGLDQILEAAALLRDCEDLAIVLVGDGPEKERLQKKAEELALDNVRFLPPVPRREMPELIASADIALVSLGTHLPGAVPSKIYEAMGSALPIVLVADGEPVEIIKRTGSGIPIPMNDPQALAAALRALTSNQQSRKEFGARGRQAAEEQYNRNKIVSRFIDLLEASAC